MVNTEFHSIINYLKSNALFTAQIRTQKQEVLNLQKV